MTKIKRGKVILKKASSNLVDINKQNGIAIAIIRIDNKILFCFITFMLYANILRLLTTITYNDSSITFHKPYQEVFSLKQSKIFP